MGTIDSGVIANELMKFVKANILAENVVLTPQTVLRDVGIDSYSIVEIILFIERKYGVVIPDEQLLPENFRTIEVLAHTTQKLV